MADELLPYYEKELAFIRLLGSEFSKENAKVAGRLGINSETIEDPHVSRLIESYAYLNARIQHKLDDDFPELSDSILNVLFPHYQRPIPSMTILQFEADLEQLDSVYTIEKSSLLETELFKGERCHFTTIYPIELIPAKVSSATLIGSPFVTPGSSSIKNAQSVLKISLDTFAPEILFSENRPSKIRFYLKGQPQHINPLYEMLLNDSINIVMARSEDDVNPIYLGKDCIKAVGFSEQEGILPYPASSFLGYRLLTEYFTFQEKFMFIDFTGLSDSIPDDMANQLNLYVYFTSSDIELEHNISSDTFLLGCSPAVNLFEQKTDPIKLDHRNNEYFVLPDSRRPLGFEIYSIDTVIATNSDGEQQEFFPMYGLTHEHHDSDNFSFWYASRRDAKQGIYERDNGTDVFLSLVDLNFNPNVPEDRIIIINSTCSNRNQPEILPFNSKQPVLQCVDSAPPCSRIHCVIKPSSTVHPPLRDNARWRLLSHLNLNNLSLTGRDNATQALKEILRLYDFKDSSITRALIAAIDKVSAQPINAPLTIDGRVTLCRGIEVEITLDDSQLVGSSSYLFASVLEHFFGLYCSINSFTRVLVKLKNKEGYLKKCPPRAGQKTLL